ncbi:MAG: dTDP-4-amino-4,6-dideoxygalactose transaminase [Eubacteriales bacterium]|nr:dTDP-4-amino-4,6-dideoxygalactose transaminase [Eubacteriales bacterium]
MRIPFQKPFQLVKADPYIQQVILSGRTEGDGIMTARCRAWLSERLSTDNILMMSSCTQALEASIQLAGLCPGEEVIIPSFSHPSAANAVLLAKGTVVFTEVEPVHLTLDPLSLERHITSRTRAVIVVHYGGISCDMDLIMAIARRHDLVVIEDCAQSFLSQYKQQMTGTIGHFGCFSFHGTKDVVAGEGGALLVNDDRFVQTARTYHQKGTNRNAFENGTVNYYEWVSAGSSCSPGELSMALLLAQLETSEEILNRHCQLFDRYFRHFSDLPGNPMTSRLLGCSSPRPGCSGNGHLFYLLLQQAEDAENLISFLSVRHIDARNHFVPLHESLFGQQFIRQENQFSTELNIGQRLVRLPVFSDMTDSEQSYVIDTVDQFLCQSNGAQEHKP